MLTTWQWSSGEACEVERAMDGHTGCLTSETCDLDWIRDRELETASEEGVTAASDIAWKALAEHLVERSPFYAEKYRSAGVAIVDVTTVRDLPRLPTTTKDEIRRTQEEDPPFGGHVGVDPATIKRIYQTSGSSGRPSTLALTKADIETWTTIGSRSYWATGVHPHNSVLTAFGAGPFVASHTHESFDRIGVRRVPMAPGDTSRVLSAMEAGLGDTLLATPSFALHLASVIESRGLDGPSMGIRHLAVGGEPGGGIPDLRRRIEQGFGAYVTEAGGIGDISPSLWGECPDKGGMHFCGQGLVWPEMIDPVTEDSIDIEPGARGEMVWTTLVREAMPMIRFRSRDIVEIQDGNCPCGRTSFRMRIIGRSDDMFIVRGVNVFPTAIQSVVAEFQPAVTGRSRVVLPAGSGVAVDPPVPVEVEVADGSDDEPGLADEIASAIRSRLLFRTKVTFVPHDTFGDAGYKTRPIIRGDQGGT